MDKRLLDATPKFVFWMYLLLCGPWVFAQKSEIQLMILGIAQDAGYPQVGCDRSCCRVYREGLQEKRLVSSLGILDHQQGKAYLIDATPDFTEQWDNLRNALLQQPIFPDGIFLTHAHIGHYTGLMYLGREAMGAWKVPVYAMPKMRTFLETNGPWSQLVALKNIEIRDLEDGRKVELPKLTIRPFIVPHRDEFSETVGFEIEGPQKRVVFIPDINKWQEWEEDLVAVIQGCDIALVDGTFNQNGELPGRDMSKIPLPFVVETVEHLRELKPKDKAKVFFTHFNHTNPLLTSEKARWELLQQGFNVAVEGMIIDL